MSKKNFALLIALFLSTAALILADSSEQLVTLKDGSEIKGHVSGIANTGAQVATTSQK